MRNVWRFQAQAGRQTAKHHFETVNDSSNVMAAMEQDQSFVEYMVRAIVNHPDDVRTERTVDERGVLITLHINQEDMGYVIGRQGQTARALRTLLKIVGAKNDARVNLKIYEPEGARPPRKERRDDRPERGGDRSDRRAAPVDDTSVDDLGI